MSKIENYYATSGYYDVGWNKESKAPEKADGKKETSANFLEFLQK